MVMLCLVVGVIIFTPFIITGVVDYFDNAAFYDDRLYFMRKIQFKKKMQKNGYQQLSNLIISLLQTNEQVWQYKKPYCVYTPFPDTVIRLYVVPHIGVEIIEGTGSKRVFTALRDESRAMKWREPLEYNPIDEGVSLQLEKVFGHLMSVRASLLQAGTTSKKVVQEDTLLAVVLEEPYHDEVSSIYSLMAKLKQEKDWLSVEAFHQITETFPKDVHALSEAYHLVRDKEKVKGDVEEALHTMKQKLRVLMDEVEMRKQQAVKKQKLVIEKR